MNQRNVSNHSGQITGFVTSGTDEFSVYRTSMMHHIVEFAKQEAVTLWNVAGQTQNARTHRHQGQGCLTGCAGRVQRKGHRQEEEDRQLHGALLSVLLSSSIPARVFQTEWELEFARHHGTEVPIRSKVPKAVAVLHFVVPEGSHCDGAAMWLRGNVTSSCCQPSRSPGWRGRRKGMWWGRRAGQYERWEGDHYNGDEMQVKFCPKTVSATAINNKFIQESLVALFLIVLWQMYFSHKHIFHILSKNSTVGQIITCISLSNKLTAIAQSKTENTGSMDRTKVIDASQPKWHARMWLSLLGH